MGLTTELVSEATEIPSIHYTHILTDAEQKGELPTSTGKESIAEGIPHSRVG